MVLCCLLLAGCATTPEVQFLVGPRRSNSGDKDVAASISIVQRLGKHAVIGCMHQSEPSRGAPFNGKDEETWDTCGAGMRFGGKAKHR